MHNPPKGYVRNALAAEPPRCPLMTELCRVFHSKPVGMFCAISHGQLVIDGYIIRPQHLRRWPKSKLLGRTAQLVSAGRPFRTARLWS